jgi:O-antigen/teichoic acid export membrane protein
MNRAGAFSKVAGNVVANLLRMSAAWIIVLFLPPLLVRVLDKPTYATWVLIVQIGAYVTLIDSGIQSAICRFVARAEGLQDRRYLGHILSSASFILIAAALAATGATVVCSWQLGHIFHGIPSSIVPGARSALLIIGISLAMSLPFSAIAGTFLGLQKNEINALAGSAGKLAGAAGAGWAAWHHEGLLAMALWIGLGNVLQSALYLVSWVRLRLRGVLRPGFVTGAAVREFSRFCAAMFATQLSAVLITGLDMPVVTAFDFRHAAYYAVAATAGSMLAAPQAAVVTTLIPVASGLSTTESPQRLGQIVLKTTRYANAVLCLLTLPLLFALYPFLHLWVGLDYAGHAFPLAVILIVAQFIRLTLMPYAAIGFGTGQQERMLISPLGEGVVNLMCSVAGAWLWGALGVALGTLAGVFVGIFLHFVNSMPRTDTMAFSRLRLAISGIGRPVACCLPSLTILLVLHRMGGLPAQLSLVAAAELAAAGLLWMANFDAAERRQLVASFTRATRVGAVSAETDLRRAH